MFPDMVFSCRGFDDIIKPLNSGQGSAAHRSDIDDFRLHLLECPDCRRRLNKQALDFLFDGVSEELRHSFGV